MCIRDRYKTLNVDSNDYYVITNHGKMIINEGVTIESASTHSSAIENGWYTASANTTLVDSEMIFNGGVIAGGGLYTVKNDDYGKMIIYGGTFTNDVANTGCVLNWNDLTIVNGTFIATNSSVATMAASKSTAEPTTPKYDYEIGSTTIQGGKFKGFLGTNKQ